jgi:multiple sugar transport system permease protein
MRESLGHSASSRPTLALGGRQRLHNPFQMPGIPSRARQEYTLMVVPAIVITIVVGLFPVLYALWVSFHRYEVLSPHHLFTGWENYRTVIDDPVFWQSAARTALYVVIVVPSETIVGLLLAVLVEGRAWARRVFFPVFLLPVFIMPVVVGYLWRQLWEPSFGAVNEVLSLLLHTRVDIPWLTNPTASFAALAITEIWQWIPFMFVVLLAAITAVPEEIREAAQVDGAGGWAMFWHIVLQIITPVMVLAISIRTLDAANFFATVYAITGGGPGTSTYSFVYYIWNLAHFGADGAASAAAFLFLLMLVIPASTILAQVVRQQSVHR